MQQKKFNFCYTYKSLIDNYLTTFSVKNTVQKILWQERIKECSNCRQNYFLLK